jgi:hypothetical protein
MRVRHRIPSIFNLSMVDVLCCALGCVILLWLLNLREAKYHQDSAAQEHRTAEEKQRQTAALLEEARGERDRAVGRVESLDKERERLRGRLAELEASVAELEGKLKSSAASTAALEDELRASRKRQETTAARLAAEDEKLKQANARLGALQAAADRVPGLERDLTAMRARYAEEAALARSLEKEVAARLQALAEANKRLEAAQAQRSSLERDLAQREGDLSRARAYRDKWSAGEERVATLEKERQNLQIENIRLRAAADNRFAGIQLTGRRVVFLVDMSGSMDLVDEKTPAPTKWADVRATVARLMRSLPELEKYQVLIFAERTTYLLGNPGGWLDYDPKTSAERVVQGLSAIKPVGGTDMYAALEAAFRLRPQGLDTIYLLSDGLPNLGEGLPPENPDKPLSEAERNAILSQRIRRMLKTVWNVQRPGQPRVRINAVGFFFESPEVGAFLWALARENDGSFVGMSKP